MSIKIIHEYVRKVLHELQFEKKAVPADAITYVLRQVRTLFLSEPMMIQTTCPMHIVGDLHGQYDDLLKIFERLGYPSRTNRYVFLGDFVDRGDRGIETFLLVACYKILYPESVFMLRGNHESADISREYGFLDECKRRYSMKLWRHFVDVFDSMSVCATLGFRNDEPLAMCMHGGISKYLNNLHDINKIKKPVQISDEGILCDLLWSDPAKQDGYVESSRGVSYTFGLNQLNRFMTKFNLELIIRAHEVVEDGYEFFGNRRLVTIFSASRYCGEFDNSGAVMLIDSNFQCSFEIFK